MKVHIDKFMTHDVVVALWSETMSSAYSKMQTLSCRHLPVISDDGHLVGILSERDCQRAMYIPDESEADRFPKATFSPEATVSQFMTSQVVSVSPQDSIAKAARLMIAEKISSLVILDKERTSIMGILTQEDLLKALLWLLEEPNTSSVVRIGIERLEIPVGELAHLIAQTGI
jgi:acetoin utilization protein AcuB